MDDNDKEWVEQMCYHQRLHFRADLKRLIATLILILIGLIVAFVIIDLLEKEFVNMDHEETHIPLNGVIKSLLAGWDLPRKQLDMIETAIGREYVVRHTYLSTDKFELPTAKGLLVLGADSEGTDLSVYNMYATDNYNEKKDVIQPVVNSHTKFIVIIGNTTGKGPSTLWKVSIKQVYPAVWR